MFSELLYGPIRLAGAAGGRVESLREHAANHRHRHDWLRQDDDGRPAGRTVGHSPRRAGRPQLGARLDHAAERGVPRPGRAGHGRRGLGDRWKLQPLEGHRLAPGRHRGLARLQPARRHVAPMVAHVEKVVTPGGIVERQSREAAGTLRQPRLALLVGAHDLRPATS